MMMLGLRERGVDACSAVSAHAARARTWRSEDVAEPCLCTLSPGLFGLLFEVAVGGWS
jgi:hypothetical protein